MHITSILLFLCSFFWVSTSLAGPSDWAIKLCKQEPKRYSCAYYRINKYPYKYPYIAWKDFFRNPYLLRTMMAVNRRNTYIWRNHIVAQPIPIDADYMSLAPFFPKLNVSLDFIVVDLRNLAWGAYRQGRLINWGPANGGSKRCKETGKLQCKTHTGTFKILRLDKAGKRSDLYPIDCKNKKKCGHPMPYYMPFHSDGTGLHGDKWLVGRNASHGCVRLLKEDARWLHFNFAKVGMKVIVLDY